LGWHLYDYAFYDFRIREEGWLDFNPKSVKMLRSFDFGANMYAIIEDGGRQYKVTSGDTIRIERSSAEDQKAITFDRVLMVGGEGQPRIGAPVVAGASVSAEVLREVKGPKIDIQKYRRRKGFHKKIGHRQKQVEVKISAINV